MPHFFSVDELIVDDSFINYCLQKNQEDSLYWQRYLTNHPLEREKIEEARKIVLGLTVMLRQQKDSRKTTNSVFQQKDKEIFKIPPLQKLLKYAAAVAAVFIIALIVKTTIDASENHKGSHSVASINTERHTDFLFKTQNGEKKLITLPENTNIWLNAGSQLQLDKGFGKENRRVYLSGEALFDVTHNEKIPFIVCIQKCEIKDMGTLFNVKAYPGDKQSETSLLRGKVEIELNNSPHKIFLSPNEKVVINNDDVSLVKKKQSYTTPVIKDINLLPLSYNQKDSAVIETAWAQNRLEIVNEDFFHMKDKLERWFNVKINIKDNAVGKYPFTATFENEDIRQVLQALQYAYHFNYTIEKNEVNISK